MEIFFTILFFVAVFAVLKVKHPKCNSDKELDKLTKFYNGTE